MDRGRAGGFVTDNNFALVLVKKKQRQEHLHRLEKIKSRIPGSGTLDNTPPVIVKAALNNPRKIALRNEFNIVVEKENRSLLKRISMILTAPPKITTKDYYDMKKLCAPGTVDAKDAFERKLRDEKTKRFFDNIRRVKPMYNTKSWEEDYKKQRFNQRFMRQVKYRRPKDFVDPLNPPATEGEEDPSSILQSTDTDGNEHNNPHSRSADAAEDGMSLLEDLDAASTSSDKVRGSASNSVSRNSNKKGSASSHVDRVRAVKQQKQRGLAPLKTAQRHASNSSLNTAPASTTQPAAVEIPDTQIEAETPGADAEEDVYEADFEAMQQAAGPRQNSSRGQRPRPAAPPVQVTTIEDEEVDYGADDDFEKPTIEAMKQHQINQSNSQSNHSLGDRKASGPSDRDSGFSPDYDEGNGDNSNIAIQIFTGDDDYSHDGFFDEEEEIKEDGEETEKEAKGKEKSRNKSPTTLPPIKAAETSPRASGEASSTAVDSTGEEASPKTTYHHDKKKPASSSSASAGKKSGAKKSAPSSSSGAHHPSSSHGHGSAPPSHPSSAVNHNNTTRSSSNAKRKKPSSSSASPALTPLHSHHGSARGERGSSGAPSSSAGAGHHPKSAHSHPHSAHGASSRGHHASHDHHSPHDHHHQQHNDHHQQHHQEEVAIFGMDRVLKLIREVVIPSVANNPLALKLMQQQYSNSSHSGGKHHHHGHHHHHHHHHNKKNGSSPQGKNQPQQPLGMRGVREGLEEQVSYMDATVQCLLLHSSASSAAAAAAAAAGGSGLSLLLRIEGQHTEVPLIVEAEILEQDLHSICDLPEDFSLMPHDVNNSNGNMDLNFLSTLAQELVENVEVRWEYQQEPRIVLHLVHEPEDDAGNGANNNSNNGANATGGANNGEGKEEEKTLTATASMMKMTAQQGAVPFTSATEEEVEEILLPDGKAWTVLRRGLRIPVSVNMQNQSLSIGNLNKLIEYAKTQQRVEYIYAICRVQCVDEELLKVDATTMSSSSKLFRRGSKTRPAVTQGSQLTLTLTLPSVVQLDAELVLDFAANVLGHLKVEHDYRTGLNALVMQTPQG